MFAQTPRGKEIIRYTEDPYYHRSCKSLFTSTLLQIENNHSEAVKAYLKQTSANLQAPEVSLTLLHDIESPGGRHLTFEQTFSGMPVFHSQVKVNLDRSNRIRSIFDNSWNTAGWNVQAIESAFENVNLQLIASHFRKQRSIDANSIKGRKVVAVLDDVPVALGEIELWNRKTGEHLLMLADNGMNVFLKLDLNVYWRDTATAMVFIPDPLTSARVYYGASYVDSSDQDVAVLNAQRKQVAIEVTFNGTNYVLENRYAVLVDYSVPHVPPAVSPVPAFHFTRAQPGFEDVNAFYHISVFSQYVQSLGFGGLVSVPVLIDAHAQDGADNSMFSYGFNGPQLFFGEGGIDDAEDADVIVHEMGHALSYSASPNSNYGRERESVDEAIGDYLATSYSRAIDTFRWADMFTWDGHNEYWKGRTAATPKVYPADLGSSIHGNGEIYNAALTKIWESIGKEKTDRILLQSLYGLAQNISMKDAAMLLYDADSALYGGENFCVIYRALLAKGLTDTFYMGNGYQKVNTSIPVQAGDDQIVCSGDSVVLGVLSSSRCDYIYRWVPAEGLGSPQSPVTRAAPAATTAYTLFVSQFNGDFNLDEVTVTFLNSCFLNTEGFTRGEDVIIKLPQNTNNNIVELCDISGKKLFRHDNLPGEDYALSGDMLAPGVYILRVTSIRGKQSQKLVKLTGR